MARTSPIRRWLQDLPIVRKLTLAMMLTAAVVLLLSSGVFLSVDYYQAGRNLRQELSATADLIAAHSAAALAFQDQRAAAETLRSLAAQKRVISATLYDRSGNVLAHYGERQGASAASSPRHGDDAIEVTRPVILDSEKIGSLDLWATTSEIAAHARQYLIISLIVLLSALSLGTFFAIRLGALIAGPLLNLASTADAVSRNGDYSLRALAHHDDEIGTLIDAFNQMLGQVERRDRELESHRGHLEEEVARRTADLVRLNAELTVAKDRAEEVSRLKGQFLANMSHEIRTPMNGVIGMTELALETVLTEQQRDYLNVVRTSAASLLSVINDVLDFSKIEAGKLVLHASDFDINELLRDVMGMFLFSANQKGIELLADIAPEVSDMLTADSGRLRQILINLVGNAVKFTARGEVSLRVKPGDQPSNLHFIVSDTGIGIPLDHQEDIFDAFVQVDGSSTRRHTGTGLGLAICRRLVELMGGRIWMESQPGRGSDFHFMVPCPAAPADPDHITPMAALPPDLAVLIVDDNETNRLILRDVLVHWGMLPELAVSGKVALEMVSARAVARRPFDLILLDARMPEMDGFTVAQLIREDPTLSGPSILMLSSVDLLGGVPGQLDSYLMKPVSRPALRTAMLRAIRAPRSSPPQPVRPSPTPLKSDPHRRQLHILVAEDNLVNQKVAQLLLGKKGHHVVIAGDGNQAVQRFSQSHFDLVFMDVQMPELSGLEATRLIRKHEDPATRRTPIIALTAHAMASDREECLAAGMDDFLGKPIESQELYAVVTRWTEAAVPEHLGV